jgi:hypothetical protein
MFGLRDGQQAESGTRTGTDTVGRWVAATEGADQPPDVSSRLIHGRYRLIAELGVGGMGVTYRAWDTTAGIPVVVKMPRREVRSDSEAMQRFAREIDAMLAVPHEDIVPITTERSFNAQCVTFQATYPFTLGLVSKDFVENESGLEYIGESNQQMGDGGVILQVTDSSGAVVAATSSDWRGLSIFRAPLNTDCESSSDPLADCESEILPEPAGWAEPGFDDSGWSPATEYTEAEVQAKDGYTQVTWDATAKLIWADDLNVDNTILWRYTVTG